MPKELEHAFSVIRQVSDLAVKQIKTLQVLQVLLKKRELMFNLPRKQVVIKALLLSALCASNAKAEASVHINLGVSPTGHCNLVLAKPLQTLQLHKFVNINAVFLNGLSRMAALLLSCDYVLKRLEGHVFVRFRDQDRHDRLTLTRLGLAILKSKGKNHSDYNTTLYTYKSFHSAEIFDFVAAQI